MFVDVHVWKCVGMGIAVAVSIYLVVEALLVDPGAGECGTGLGVLWCCGCSV